MEQPLCSSWAARAPRGLDDQSCDRVTPIMTIGDGPTRDERRGLLALLVEPLRAEGIIAPTQSVVSPDDSRPPERWSR